MTTSDSTLPNPPATASSRSSFLYTIQRVRIVARATLKEAIRQPVFILMIVLSMGLLVLNTYVSFFTFGEDVKILKDCGLATILIASLMLAVWTASNGISAEIEGKTTMTLLSKPLNRRQFIVGKFVGIVQAITVMIIPLAICLLALIYYKIGYDARESSRPVPDLVNWTDQFLGMTLPFEIATPVAERWNATVNVVPGIVLIYFEAIILTAISVAIATRAPMVVNIVTCLVIYIVGNLAPLLVKVSTENALLEIVQFIAQLISIVLPSLAMFDTKAAIATDKVVPLDYLGWSAVYCVIYSTAAILLAFVLFEDRDLG